MTKSMTPVDWEGFFYTFGSSQPMYEPGFYSEKLTIEQIYQAFKARMEAEKIHE